MDSCSRMTAFYYYRLKHIAILKDLNVINNNIKTT